MNSLNLWIIYIISTDQNWASRYIKLKICLCRQKSKLIPLSGTSGEETFSKNWQDPSQEFWLSVQLINRLSLNRFKPPECQAYICSKERVISTRLTYISKISNSEDAAMDEYDSRQWNSCLVNAIIYQAATNSILNPQICLEPAYGDNHSTESALWRSIMTFKKH